VDPSAYERLGGEPALRVIVEDFVRRITSDVMIGFFFAKIDRARLTEMELSLAREQLGGPGRYEGRPLRQAHGPHRIMGGHFARRREILRQTLVAHGAPDDVIASWLAHVDALRAEITPDAGSECAGSARERT
jgi:hemoglobin